MTKAERNQRRNNAIAGKSLDPALTMRLLDHIDALEAQLAQKDERIRKLREFIHNSPSAANVYDQVTAVQQILATDANEGEGK